MKLVYFLTFFLIPILGISQIESQKLEKAVDYINWNYTDNIVQKLKKSDRKGWQLPKTKLIDNTQDWDSLQRALELLPQIIDNVSKPIEDRKSVFNDVHDKSELEKVLIGIPTTFIIDNKTFTIDNNIVKKTTTDIVKYLELDKDNSNRKLYDEIVKNVDNKIENLKLQNAIVFWPFFAYSLFLLLFILIIVTLLFYFKYVKIGKKLQTLNQEPNHSSSSLFELFPTAPTFKLTVSDKQAIINDVVAEIRKDSAQESAPQKEEFSPINNSPFVTYEGNNQPFTKYYFAAPYDNGFSDQYKTEHIISGKSLYSLDVDNTGVRGKFKLLNEPWVMRFAVNERQLYIDPVCKIDGKFTQRPNSIKVIEEGVATLSNGHWTVSDSQKALIRYD